MALFFSCLGCDSVEKAQTAHPHCPLQDFLRKLLALDCKWLNLKAAWMEDLNYV